MLSTLTRCGALAAVLFFAAGLTGCDAFEIFGGGTELTAIVEEVGADYLVADANRYAVDSNTTFEVYDSLADIQVGDSVEITYEDRAGARVATEISDGS